MIPTMHALKRMDQRAIPPDFVELLDCFGVHLAAGKEWSRFVCLSVKRTGSASVSRISFNVGITSSMYTPSCPRRTF